MHKRRYLEWHGLIFFFVLLQYSHCDLTYSVQEELKRGSVIGNIAQDLKLDLGRLYARKIRVKVEGSEKEIIGINLRNGDLFVTGRIDREEQCGENPTCILKYDLLMENPLELHRLSLQVLDINDNQPIFPKDIFKLEIRESTDKGARYRINAAHDADIGQNTVQSYILQQNPNFVLNIQTSPGRKYGELVLDKESDSMKQNLIVAVKDNGQPSLSATCAMFLLISDNLAEVPELKDISHDENNSKLTSYLIIALVSVSTFFLTFIIIILGVRFCRRRKPRLLFDGAVAIPGAYLPPNYSDVDGTGTLRSTYNYDAYLTTGSRTSDFKFVSSYNDNTLPADQTLKKSPTEFADVFRDNKDFPEVKQKYICFVFLPNNFMGELTYSVQEELKHGSVIANVARDLGLESQGIDARKARVEMEGSEKEYIR
ncbi:protocadherin beta-11-like, partial [Poecilia latipinna]|uniref:protocadherin beta-11-like n=1 Tax=Poecilia latipinna TaxID=48699 RepID=UPI00072E0BB4